MIMGDICVINVGEYTINGSYEKCNMYVIMLVGFFGWLFLLG